MVGILAAHALGVPCAMNPIRVTYFRKPPPFRRRTATMTRPRRQLPSFRRRSALEASLPPSAVPRTLGKGVLQAFPDANPGRLAAWLTEAEQQPGIESEFLLFVALMVGVRLRVTREDITQVLEELWAWLTTAPRGMKRPLADLLLEVLTPELVAVVERRGWQFGATGKRIRRRGRPPESRALWTTALLVDSHLQRAGVARKRARELAVSLAAVLSGRTDAGVSELYRTRGPRRRPDPKPLLSALQQRYEDWLQREGQHVRDPAPDQSSGEEGAAWRRRRRPLWQILGVYGAEHFARLILAQVPDKLWKPFAAVS